MLPFLFCSRILAISILLPLQIAFLKMDTTAASTYIHDYLVSNAEPNSLSKGRKLAKAKKGELISWDVDTQKAEYKIQSEEFSRKFYKVSITDFLSSSIATTCNCPYDWEGICKHRVAGLIALSEELILSQLRTQNAVNHQAHTVLNSPVLTELLIKENCSAEAYKEALTLKNNLSVLLLSTANETAVYKVSSKLQTVEVALKRNQNQIITSCGCEDPFHKLCIHKVAALLHLKSRYDEYAFYYLKDWTEEKKQLLAEYGYELESPDVEKLFDFKIINGQMSLIKKDPAIEKVSSFSTWQTIFEKHKQLNDPSLPEQHLKQEHGDEGVMAYGLSFISSNDNSLPSFELIPLVGNADPQSGKLKNIKNFYEFRTRNLPTMEDVDHQLIRLGFLLSFQGISDFLTQKEILTDEEPSHLSFISLNQLEENEIDIIRKYIIELTMELFDKLQDKKVYVLQNKQNIQTRSINEVKISKLIPALHFNLTESKNFVEFKAYIKLNDHLIPINEIKKFDYAIISYSNNLYAFTDLYQAKTFNYFHRNAFSKIVKTDLTVFLKNVVLPLQKDFSVVMNLTSVSITEEQATPTIKLYLRELDNFLLFTPAFEYKTREVAAGDQHHIVYEEGGNLFKLYRDKVYENEKMDFLASLHPEFSRQKERGFFYVDVNELLLGGKFLGIFEKLREKQIPILGFKELSRFKYNTNRPSVRVTASSGIDWFDVNIQIMFGDQSVKVKDVKKALVNKQNYVVLDDGSLGIMPEEWLKKYSALFKLGTIKDDNIQVSKLHFSLVDQLYDEIDDVQVQAELLEKRQRLAEFKEIKKLKMPKQITADLRDYQKEGFNWLNFLDEFGWGGCLADDMGLGKTLQMITFLAHQKENNKSEHKTNLVVVPTTLIFNWTKEVEKFCPNLTVHTYRGIERDKSLSSFKQYDIILTTYGAVRADIEVLSRYQFNYVILDESQVIKNPASQIAKSVKLLNAKNRVVLTGTPIENNTFDLYSQMDFLNPGMLGSIELFKMEYSSAIDSRKDKDKSEELKKLIFPFILRRTKEQVAKELPEKTEMVLYCEMGTDQRAVYDAFKNEYRDRLLGLIDTEGMNKSRMHILEGLLKLRQICDSPALLSDEGEFSSESVKLDEITREILENTGNHKILVFSQFLKMLALIKNKLEEAKIGHEYLDGSVQDRKERVEHFQNDPNCRVFLISLRTGGWGINLTEADYVYIVDPWWNPAVEQQAIDRTHRIGQTQKVFAYKMICKDTVEEKIMLLQESKKQLANELISSEAGFLKNLSREDIVMLFS